MLAHVEVQRVKTRGPNPNPTAQAQSKCCLPPFTKTQNIIKILPAGLPNPVLFWYLFRAFSLLMPTRHQHGPQGYPNRAPGCRHEAPRSPQSAQKTFNYTACVSKWKPKVPQWSPKATQSTKKRHHEALQSATKTKKTYTNRPRPGARRRRRRSGRGLEGRAHQAACRKPRSGAEAENRGTSSEGCVLILK